MTDQLSRLTDRLGYRFADPSLLESALTHRSVSRRNNNERLEFLGDALLSQVVSIWLYHHFPEASEGQLTRMRATLVRGQTLAEIARELELGECLKLGSGEMKSGGSRRDSILADTVEALLGAILLDGGEEPCRQAVLRWLGDRLQQVSPQSAVKDAKTRLQEWLQGRSLPLPDYEVVTVHGQAPNQRFDVHCRIESIPEHFEASGSSRRKAEQKVAEKALAWLEAQQ